MDVMLTSADLTRYSRQIALTNIGKAGQEKLKRSSVLIIGTGGGGSAAALYAGAMGIGTLGLLDPDVVELSNLSRQILYSHSDLGRFKVEAAKERILANNPDIRVNTYPFAANGENLADLSEDYDFILDDASGLQTKFMINDVLATRRKPYSFAGTNWYNMGKVGTVAGGSACFRCMLDLPADLPADTRPGPARVIGPLLGVIGSIQAMEAVKYLVGGHDLLIDRVLMFNLVTLSMKISSVEKRPNCPFCNAEGETVKGEVSRGERT